MRFLYQLNQIAMDLDNLIKAVYWVSMILVGFLAIRKLTSIVTAVKAIAPRGTMKTLLASFLLLLASPAVAIPPVPGGVDFSVVSCTGLYKIDDPSMVIDCDTNEVAISTLVVLGTATFTNAIFTGSITGFSTAEIVQLSLSTAALEVSTISLQTQVDALVVSTGVLHISTQALDTRVAVLEAAPVMTALVDDPAPVLGGDMDGGDQQLNNISTITVNGQFVSKQETFTGDLAYTFNGDPNTGIYSQQADIMNLRAGGVNYIQIENGTSTISILQSITINTLAFKNLQWAGAHTGGSQFVCVDTVGVLFISEAACP